ncbi:hypothetical protein BJ878DRAFT_536750 [Calycina marina]|uniref:Uncharacterized protein n=1 Tax=Calycina marina TaxID=1763456 RepID=A0A9P8CBM0_9HELO|nr:hypothetical protein BJ878DRAFT_536750 [Calycina marina]
MTSATSPVIQLPAGFQIRSVNDKLGAKIPASGTQNPLDRNNSSDEPPLGVLSNFQDDFHGKGPNLIFRPNNVPPTQTIFPNPKSISQRRLPFSPPIGSVPNRGLEQQIDVFLNGVTYAQAVNDVTKITTGNADGPAQAFHFESGLWMHVSATSVVPAIENSQSPISDVPQFQHVDITPTTIGALTKICFGAQTATDINIPRLPQDLTNFIATGTVTQMILDDPNTVLSNAIAGQNITSFFVFTVSTTPVEPGLGSETANTQTGPNANVAQMQSTSWVGTVSTRYIAADKTACWPIPRQCFLLISPTPNVRGAPNPVCPVNPPHEVTIDTPIMVTSTQIQYSKQAQLNFAGRSWPHVSVATLVPQAPQKAPDSAFPA